MFKRCAAAAVAAVTSRTPAAVHRAITPALVTAARRSSQHRQHLLHTLPSVSIQTTTPFLNTSGGSKEGGDDWVFDPSEFVQMAAQDVAAADVALAQMAADGVNLTPALLSATFYGDAKIVASLLEVGADANALIYDGWGGNDSYNPSEVGRNAAGHGHSHSHGHSHGHGHGHSHGSAADTINANLDRPWTKVSSEKAHNAGTAAIYRPEMRTVEANATPAELARLESLIHGVTALCIASQAGATHVAEVLIKGGADPAAPQTDAVGFTFSLGAAAEFGHVRVLQLLLDNGADPDQVAPAEGEPPLCIAARHGFGDVTQALLDAGASLDQARRSDGATALWIAAKYGRTKVVGMILDAILQSDRKEALLETVSASVGGLSPRAAAELAGHADTVDRLLLAE